MNILQNKIHKLKWLQHIEQSKESYYINKFSISPDHDRNRKDRLTKRSVLKYINLFSCTNDLICFAIIVMCLFLFAFYYNCHMTSD